MGEEDGSCAEWSKVICNTGIALNLTESCQESCNYYPQDKTRNIKSTRSYVPICKNTSICVKEGEGTTYFNPVTHFVTYKPTICTGNSSCEGELDWCREEERKEEKCPKEEDKFTIGFIRCPGISKNKEGGNGTKSIPGQCIEK